jgi:hypothetical protein
VVVGFVGNELHHAGSEVLQLLGNVQSGCEEVEFQLAAALGAYG